MGGSTGMRSGAQLLVDALRLHGVETAFWSGEIKTRYKTERLSSAG